MSTRPRDIDVFELLPAVYRLRDTERTGQLEALLELVSEQAQIVKDAIDGLWDDLFVETCSDWVVPYIADLVGANPLHEAAGGRRADVAGTIGYRRRKGTMPLLERLAREVTGWDARAVEGMELLAWTQHLEHLRYERAPEHTPPDVVPPAVGRVGTVDVRDLDAMDRLDGPWDMTSHTVDLRPASRTQGWHGLRRLLLFAWRLGSYPLLEADPVAVGTNRDQWTFDPLGSRMPLFNGGLRPTVRDGEQATEAQVVRAPIRRFAFHADPDGYWESALTIHDDTRAVTAADLICMDLSTWAPPPPELVAVDVTLGRFKYGANRVPPAGARPRVSFHFGFSADIGGGSYRRERSRARGVREDIDTIAQPDGLDDLVRVARAGGAGVASDLVRVFQPAAPATPLWRPGSFRRTVVQIEDSRTYREAEVSLSAAATQPDTQLVIQARDRERPVIAGIVVPAGVRLGRLTLNGLIIAGQVRVEGQVAELRIEHCTLVPGGGRTEDGGPADAGLPALFVDSTAAECKVRVDRSIAGPLRIRAERHELTATDSIVDAPAAPPPGADPSGLATRRALGWTAPATEPAAVATFERCTVLGDVTVRELRLATDTIFAFGRVVAERGQHGCMRFSSLERLDLARTPRRYRCQPDLAMEAVPASGRALAAERARVSFTSTRYGDPGYVQLSRDCPRGIAAGAEDGAEMGAFCHLRQPQRESNLQLRLEEYMPFGLEPGVVYVT